MAQLQQFFGTTLANWWSPKNLLLVTPSETWPLRWFYLGLLALLFIVGMVTLFLKIRPSVKGRIQNLIWVNFFLGMVLYFFRDQRIPFIGMDILRFIQELALIFWINGIVLFARTQVPKETIAEKVAARKSKYLPKSKSA
jgi:hypothetical protein